jgi:hypothetical protein
MCGFKKLKLAIIAGQFAAAPRRFRRFNRKVRSRKRRCVSKPEVPVVLADPKRLPESSGKLQPLARFPAHAGERRLALNPVRPALYRGGEVLDPTLVTRCLQSLRETKMERRISRPCSQSSSVILRRLLLAALQSCSSAAMEGGEPLRLDGKSGVVAFGCLVQAPELPQHTCPS